jgi:hypothetical protein
VGQQTAALFASAAEAKGVMTVLGGLLVTFSHFPAEDKGRGRERDKESKVNSFVTHQVSKNQDISTKNYTSRASKSSGGHQNNKQTALSKPKKQPNLQPTSTTTGVPLPDLFRTFP